MKMSNNADEHEVLVKQYLRSVLDVSEIPGHFQVPCLPSGQQMVFKCPILGSVIQAINYPNKGKIDSEKEKS